jgi:hypothetical protein
MALLQHETHQPFGIRREAEDSGMPLRKPLNRLKTGHFFSQQMKIWQFPHRLVAAPARNSKKTSNSRIWRLTDK